MTSKTPDRDSVERALYRRMATKLRRALRGASDDQLLEAVAAATADESIATVLLSAAAEAGTYEDWGEELLRGVRKKQEMLQEAGGTYTSGQVAELLGRSVPTVQQRLRRRTLLAVPLAHGEWGFPIVQFTENGVPAALGKVLNAFGAVDPWVQLSILLSDAYGEGRLIDWIREGRNIPEVTRIAGSYGIQGAA
jgi:hypothetical protein